MAKTSAQPMSKMDAVRQALKDLGNDAKPLRLQPYIKETLGIEMSVDHVSTYKSQILRKKSKRKAKKAAAPSANGAATAPATPAAKNQAAGSLSAQVAMLKQVAGSLGKDEAKKIIDLL